MDTATALTPRQRHAAAALDRVRELDTQISCLQGQRAEALAGFARVGGSKRSVVAEVALELKMGEWQIERLLALATALDTRLPHALEAMKRGEINEQKAWAIYEPTASLSDELARRVDEIMRGRLKKTPENLRRAVNRVVRDVDRDGYDRRAKAKRRERKISLIHQDEAMSTLFADLPCEQASAIYASIDQAARALRKKDKSRTLEQLRADIFAERLLAAANGDSGIRAHIYVYADLLTLIGANDDSAHLAGYGPIPAWLARLIATEPNSTWTRLITDPDTGQLLSVGRRNYRPPADLDAYIRVRARTCETPGCNRPAQFCDIDHAQDWAKNGTTDEADLRGKCRHHHLLKQEPGWEYSTGPNGITIIRTPHGRTYTKEPEPFHEPRKPNDDPPPF